MIRMTDLISELVEEESDAAKQAKSLGLTSIGFGRWADKSGKVTHTSQDGKLVPTTDPNKDNPYHPSNFQKGEPAQDKNPTTKPLDRSKSATSPRDMRDKVTLAAKTKIKQAFDNPEVQQAAREEREVSGEEMTKMTGLPEKAFRVARKFDSPDGRGEKILASADSTGAGASISYNPKKNTYTFLSDRFY